VAADLGFKRGVVPHL